MRRLVLFLGSAAFAAGACIPVPPPAKILCIPTIVPELYQTVAQKGVAGGYLGIESNGDINVPGALNLGVGQTTTWAMAVKAYNADVLSGTVTMTLDNTAADGTLKFPGGYTGYLAGRTNTETLTNKTLDGDDNTVRDLPSGAFASGHAIRQGGFSADFSGAGSALTAGTTAGVSVVYIVVPYACTVVAWDIAVDQGTAGFRVWRKATGTAIPTASDTVTSADLAISTGTVLHSTSAANWSGAAFPSIAANDIVAVQLNAASSATFARFGATCQK